MTAEISPECSLQMARIRSKDTKPEMTVRRLVHRLGYLLVVWAAYWAKARRGRQ